MGRRSPILRGGLKYHKVLYSLICVYTRTISLGLESNVGTFLIAISTVIMKMFIRAQIPQGFTLIELMVTIVVAGVLLGIGVPGFVSIINNNRLTTSANELVATLNLARSEAVKRGVQVTVRRKGSTTQVWDNGWNVFVDIAGTPGGNNLGEFLDDGDATLCETNADGSPKEDCLLKSYDALREDFTLRTGSPYANWVGYLPSALVTNATNTHNDTFRLCKGSDITTSRTIILNPVGRVRVAVGEASSCP